MTRLFHDPDNDPLTYDAESSDRSVVDVAIEEGYLVITPKRPGRSEITIIASDGASEKRLTFTLYIKGTTPHDNVTSVIASYDWFHVISHNLNESQDHHAACRAKLGPEAPPRGLE